MNDTMQIIRQDELGGTEVLKVTDVPIPEPGMGEIVVRVHAAGVNPVDRNGPAERCFRGRAAVRAWLGCLGNGGDRRLGSHHLPARRRGVRNAALPARAWCLRPVRRRAGPRIRPEAGPS